MARTVHTEAGESSSVVETRALVLTRTGRAFVDVGLAPVAGVPGDAVAHERPGSVDARAAVLAGRPPTCVRRYVATRSDVIRQRLRLFFTAVRFTQTHAIRYGRVQLASD